MKCQVLVDYLTFSIKSIQEPQEVITKYLGLDPALFQEAPYGLNGYMRMLQFSNISVMYEGRENQYFHDMGVCVSMSGNGCRTFETMSKLTFEGAKHKQGTESVAFPVLFQLLAADEDANISRIDIACDDREGHLSMDDIVRKVQGNEINSRLSRRTLYQSYNGTQNAGITAYIGAPSSDFRIRIYDKAAESGTDGHWVRVELVMRGKNANAFGAQLTNSETVGKLAAQVLNDKFSFIEKDDSNITRCTVCSWWASFVDELEAVRLVARCVVQHSVEQVHNWVEAQVGPSLAILLRTMGFGSIFALAKDSCSRLSEKQQSLIQDYNALYPARARA